MHKCVKVSVVYLGGIQDSSKGGAVIMYYYIYIYIYIYTYMYIIIWKQGVVICMMLYTSSLYNTTPRGLSVI